MPTVRPARRSDLRATARLHRRELPEGFFARLGTGFLRGYHGTFLRSDAAVALVVTGDDRAEGFLVGTLCHADHYRYVLRCCALSLAARGVLSLLVRPRLAGTFLRTRAGRYARWLAGLPRWAERGRGRRRGDGGTAGTNGPGPTATAPRVAVLTHVAVDPVARGRGYGRRLVDAFVAAARDAGATEARLVTPAGGEAVAFYERLGWRPEQVRPSSAGSLVQEFRLSLREATPT